MKDASMRRYTFLLLSFIVLANHAFDFNQKLSNHFVTPPPRDSGIFQGVVQFPGSLERLPHLIVGYKGNEYKVEVDEEFKSSANKGYYELYEQAHCRELYLLITESPAQPKQNEIKCLQTSSDFPYRLFKLSRRSKIMSDESDRSGKNEKGMQACTIEFWEVTECDNKERCMNIPDNTIIFPMDPMVIATVRSESWDAGDTLIKLPTIIFESSLENKMLHDIAARVACSWLDMKFMHPRLSMQEKVHNDRRMQLPLKDVFDARPATTFGYVSAYA